MKKLLALVLALVLALSMSVVAFAGSPVAEEADEEVTNVTGSETVPGTDNISDVVVEADDNTYIAFEDATAAYVAQNAALAKTVAADAVEFDSFDVHAIKGSTYVHTGATVTLTVSGLSKHIGKTIIVVENTDGKSEVVYTGKIDRPTMKITIDSFSTYSIFITGGSVGTGAKKSPNTGVATTAAVAAIALFATGCAFVSKKHD